MKNKSLLVVFVFTFTFTFASTCLYAQPAKTADKPALPKVIKEIPIPWPVSAIVDEKENRVFVISQGDEANSQVIVLDGRTNSIIKKIKIDEKFLSGMAGNGIGYNSDTKRIYAILNWGKIAVIDAKSYKVLAIMKDPYKYQAASVNVSERHNVIYTISMFYPHIFIFSGGSNKLVEEVIFEGRSNPSIISGDGNFLYIVNNNDGRLLKFDLKTKKVSASLPILLESIPVIDERSGLLFAASAYKLYIIDLKTFKVKDVREDIPYAFAGIPSLALNPSTNHLFVPTYGDSVSVVDVLTMEIIKTIKVGQTVRSITANSKTNRVYVTLVNESNKVIVIQDSAAEIQEQKSKTKK